MANTLSKTDTIEENSTL